MRKSAIYVATLLTIVALALPATPVFAEEDWKSMKQESKAMKIKEEAKASLNELFADNPKAKIGLPEILVGLFPGSGGTTRLVRMLGVMGAAPFLLEGKTLEPKKAKSAGLIDAVVKTVSKKTSTP